MNDMIPSRKRSLDLLEQLQQSIEQDSYYLTRDDRDQLFYELERFRQRFNDIYRERTNG